jgi:hypothetical protein
MPKNIFLNQTLSQLAQVTLLPAFLFFLNNLLAKLKFTA